MKRSFVRRVEGAWVALPEVFNLWPDTNYEAMISHSAAELSAKAWAKTGAQMRRAIQTTENNLPEVARLGVKRKRVAWGV